jgi:hypothetical protein
MIEIRISKSIYGGWNWHLYVDFILCANNVNPPSDSPIAAAIEAEEYIVENNVA